MTGNGLYHLFMVIWRTSENGDRYAEILDNHQLSTRNRHEIAAKTCRIDEVLTGFNHQKYWYDSGTDWLKDVSIYWVTVCRSKWVDALKMFTEIRQAS
jgi:hypothetical protein